MPSSTKIWLKSRLDPLISLDSCRSYSQSGEDVYLLSYFRGKSWTPDESGGYFAALEPGFYVDVGCYSPLECSNTHLFYRQGWRGINIDPTPGVKDVFDRIRRRDINLQMAVSATSGEIEFFSWGEPSVFNTVSPAVAQQRAQALGRQPRVSIVESRPLAAILDEWLPVGQQISFMTIDAEGHDQTVLESNNWDKHRPELVVVENDESLLEAILRAPTHGILANAGFELKAWLPPSTIYVDANRREMARNCARKASGGAAQA